MEGSLALIRRSSSALWRAKQPRAMPALPSAHGSVDGRCALGCLSAGADESSRCCTAQPADYAISAGPARA